MVKLAVFLENWPCKTRLHGSLAKPLIQDNIAPACIFFCGRPCASTKVISDASPVGLDAVLVQGDLRCESCGSGCGLSARTTIAVCYISCSLTDCERRYSQTEKEALALVWAFEKFQAYVYGMKFDLVTDTNHWRRYTAPVRSHVLESSVGCYECNPTTFMWCIFPAHRTSLALYHV